MLRHDLKAAEIPYRDPAGLVADFHALRHTYITNLARAGVHPKTAMDLARHGNVNLTMGRYSHTLVADRAEELGELPSLETRPDVDEQKATGTYDAVAQIDAFPAGPTSLATSRDDVDRKSLRDKPMGEGGKRLPNGRTRECVYRKFESRPLRDALRP